jgi:carboxylesterase type B
MPRNTARSCKIARSALPFFSVSQAYYCTARTPKKWVLSWPPYSLPARATLVFDHETHAESDPGDQFRQFWEKEPRLHA